MNLPAACNYSDEYNLLYFHVPRTGGSSFEALDIWDQWAGHVRARDVRRRLTPTSWKRCVKAGFVRDPLTRFASAYHYLFNMPPDHRWATANAAISAWVRDYATLEAFAAAFPTMPKRVRDDVHFRPQHRFLCAGPRKIIVDFVGRYENLTQDYARLANYCGLDHRAHPLPHKNAAQYPLDLSALALSLSSAQALTDYYAADYEVFGY